MTVSTTQNGLCKIIVGTATEVLAEIVAQGYPKPVAMFYNTTDSKYHILVAQQ